MTYTFKLSRRLAVARVGSLVLLTGLLACSASDAPVGLQSQNPLDYSLATVHLSPSSVTAEVNQPVKLAAFGRNSLGDSMVVSDLSWSASGGTISPDGTFSAGMPGRYTLTASSQHGQKTGHGTVVVLAPPVGLSAVVVSPDTATLYTHEQRAFTAIGQMSDGSEAVIGVTWSASGGTIDAGGLYTAGASGGTFRIVATNGSSGYADTAVVTILAPVVDTAQADSSQTGGGADAATVDSVVIAPSAIALGSGTTQQFTATRYFSDGTHQLGGVSYSATGGTVSSSGLYTAGQVAGSYYVIATDQNSTQNDTARVAVQAVVSQPASLGTGEPAPGASTSFMYHKTFDEPNAAADLAGRTQFLGTWTLDGSTHVEGRYSARIDWQDRSTNTSCSDARVMLEEPLPNNQTQRTVVFSYETKFSPGYEFVWPTSLYCWDHGGNTSKELVIWRNGADDRGRITVTAGYDGGKGSPDIYGDQGGYAWEVTVQAEPGSAKPANPDLKGYYRQHLARGGAGQQDKRPAAVADGQWHRFTIRITKESSLDAGDGSIQFWIDGVLVMNYNGTSSASPAYHQVFTRPDEFALFQYPTVINRGAPRAQSRWYDDVKVWAP